MFCVGKGEQEQVKPQRVAKSSKTSITDKWKMFDLLTRILHRSQKGKDSELTKYVQEAEDFWTLMVLEEHEHEQHCIINMRSMQDACITWLDELLLILEGTEKLKAPDDVQDAPPKRESLGYKLDENYFSDILGFVTNACTPILIHLHIHAYYLANAYKRTQKLAYAY